MSESNIDKLIKNMKPVLQEGIYVFSTVKDIPIGLPLSSIVGTFHEPEGITLITRKDIADNYGLKYTGTFSWILFSIESSLEAVGFTAAFSQALSKEGISCNVVAGYYHDHIFVPELLSEKAISTFNHFSENY